MSGIFPRDFDGGLPANPNTPNDPAQAFLHRHRLPVDTQALYFGNGCEVRLRPHVVNSLISEIASIADRAGVGYRASSLQNAEISIRYLLQRGLPHATMLVEQNPWHFAGTVDPPPACYTDFLTFTFVPKMPPDTDQNQGYVRLDLNGLGYRPLFRWDGTELKSGDILHLKPFMAAFFNNAWYIIGRIPPLFVVGGIDLWVRTDGNDATGDGTRNSADKAFRTIDGAFRSVGERFLATPLFSANIKLGIPGTYEGCYLGPFGSNITITGGGSDAGGWGGGSRWDYRIGSKYHSAEDNWLSAAFYGCNNVVLTGINMLLMNPGPSSACALLAGGRSTVSLTACSFDALTSNARGTFIEIRDSTVAQDTPPIYFMGNGNTLRGAIAIARGITQWCGTAGSLLVSSNFHCQDAYLQMNTLSSCTFGGFGSNSWSGITGSQFGITTNSILYHNASYPSGPIPGTIPGTFSFGAIVVPG